MLRKDGLIIPDNSSTVSLHPLVLIGMTDNLQIGCAWQNEQFAQRLRNLPVADLQAIKDHIITALRQSLDKRLPTVINIG